MPDDLLRLLLQKKAFLERELVLAVDANVQFKLTHDIRQLQQSILECGDNHFDAYPVDQGIQPTLLPCNDELSEIYDRAPSCFLYISSPPQSGKSCLLEQVQKEAAKKGWNRVFLTSVFEIRSLAERFKNENSFRIKGIDYLNYIAHEIGLGNHVDLRVQIANKNEKLLVLIDDFHIMSHPHNGELNLLFSEILKHLTKYKLTRNNFRMVVAGRYIASHNFSRQVTLPSFKGVKLQAFGKDRILEIIEASLREAELFVPDDRSCYEQWSGDIHSLSCGHPKIITHLVEHVVRCAKDEVLSDSYVSDNEHSLFESCAKPLIDSILSSITERRQKELSILSLFNWFDMDTIDDLIGHFFFEGYPMNSLGELGDFIHKAPTLGFHVPPILKELLSSNLRHSDNAHYQSINHHAAQYFRVLFRQYPTEQSYGTQSAYHTLQLDDRQLCVNELGELYKLFKKIHSEISMESFHYSLLQDDYIAKFVKETHFPLEELLQALNNDPSNT